VKAERDALGQLLLAEVKFLEPCAGRQVLVYASDAVLLQVQLLEKWKVSQG
jgi:hypothetical protein